MNGLKAKRLERAQIAAMEDILAMPGVRRALSARRGNVLYNSLITEQQREAMLAAQGGLCAICGKPSNGRALAVDHDHLTGKVRALLCQRCNTGLGHFMDNPELLRMAALYLELAAQHKQ